MTDPHAATGGVFPSAFLRRAVSGCETAGRERDVYGAVCGDSRAIRPGEIFVALKGDKFDAHDFIPDVVAKGAGAVICRKDYRIPAGAEATCAFYRVADVLTAYRELARAWRERFSIPVVVVAGAVGKTTTKELIAACLRGAFSRLLKTEGSENGFIGVPKTLLRLRDGDEAAVIEIGIDDIGAMAQHLEVVRPTVAVVTAIGPEHLENLKDLDTVAREETLALDWTARHGGVPVVNLDDPYIVGCASLPRAVGYTMGAVPRLAHAVAGESVGGNRLRLQGEGLNGLQLEPPLPGDHNARNLVAAVAVARAAGVAPEAIAKGLSTFQRPSGRSELKELRGVRVVCDYYNASPPSMRAGLSVLKAMRAGKATAWACLGDMLELGDKELDYHRELAEPVLQSGAAHVLLFGPRMKALETELRSRGFAGVRHYPAIEQLSAELTSAIRPGDIVLIKGSRSMKMERVYQALESGLANKEVPS